MLQLVKLSVAVQKQLWPPNEGKFELNWKHGLLIKFNFVHINFNNLDVMKPTNNNTTTDNTNTKKTNKRKT